MAGEEVVAVVEAVTMISRIREAEGTMMMAIRAAEALPGAVTREVIRVHPPEVSSCTAVVLSSYQRQSLAA